MPIVEIDALQHGDMTYELNIPGGGTGHFVPGRITTADAGGTSYLVASGRGIGVFEIEGSGGLSYKWTLGTSFDKLEYYDFESSTITSFEKGGSTYIYLSGRTQEVSPSNSANELGISVLRIDGNGTLDLIQQKKADGAPWAPGPSASVGVDPAIINIGGRDILVSSSFAGRADGTFETYLIKNNGKLKHLQSSEPSVGTFDKYDTVSVGGKTFVVAHGFWAGAPLQVLEVKKSGAMVPRFELPISDKAIYNRVLQDFATFEIDGRSFVAVGESTGGTILVYEIDATGRLSLVEQEFAGSHDSWRYPGALEGFEQNGRHYLAAGGGSGVGIFEVSAGGALTEVDEFSRSGVYSFGHIDTMEVNGNEYIFASTGAPDKLVSLRFVQHDDRILGGGGRNRIDATEDDDQVFGGGGGDRLSGLDGDDMIEGGRGGDVILGDAGQDNLFGGAGNDRVKGGEDQDFIFGDAGRDKLFGEAGNDYIDGGANADKLYGGDGFDRVFGGAGNDLVYGEASNDTVTDGAGKDTLFGGDGADIFVLWRDRTPDVIADYEDESDRIDLTEFGPGLEFSMLNITQKGNDLQVGYGGDRLLIKARDGFIADYELSLQDFIFA